MTRIIHILLAAALSGAAVSLGGLLSFVGLLVPHAVRRVTGGASGVGILVKELIGIPIFVTGLVLNIPLFIIPHII